MENIYRSKVPPYTVPENLSLHQFLTQYNPDICRHDDIILEDLALPLKRLTYGGLRTKSAIGAASLQQQFQLQPGDTAIIYATNSVDYSLFAHSIMWMGCVIAGVNIAWSGAELAHAIETVEPKVIACDASLRHRVEEGLRSVTGLKHVPRILILGEQPGNFPRSFIDEPPLGSIPLPPFDLSIDDSRKHACLILFSSGTTGLPKAVLLSHFNIIAHLLSARTSDARLNGSSSREVFFAPFAHMLGALGAILVPPFVGSYVGVMKEFELQDYIKACAKSRATILKAVPSVVVAFAQHPLAQKLNLTSVNNILSAGATLKPEVVAKLQNLLKGVSFVQGYGEIRVVDEDYNDVEPGQAGEVLLRSPTVFMYVPNTSSVSHVSKVDCRGYKKNQKATQESFHQGWLRTGDVLSIDDDGFLWFHERRKELIKVKGHQVAPSELEGILGSHDLVIEAAVCGYFDADRQTEWPIGYVVLAPSVPQTEYSKTLKAIHVWLDNQVASYKRLRGGLHYIDSVPKNPTGKLMRQNLPIKLAEKRKTKI
ncbi:hypothetical protein PENARI_c005G11496 [Penicillium arizonense]|uniref:AMP-dependent synthetase/ligase domain-containing protein n=1 Tax=Penicillium arizonense TaxID=1835702 RepID=A0A1F5LQN2_PENAI|nr:hypothetical protein PENARI_c005G11496 [Penicillium arizonense]OGE55191.1 hypothetical protein PENARI_c005G11496 [Penicillium arizonense]